MKYLFAIIALFLTSEVMAGEWSCREIQGGAVGGATAVCENNSCEGGGGGGPGGPGGECETTAATSPGLYSSAAGGTQCVASATCFNGDDPVTCSGFSACEARANIYYTFVTSKYVQCDGNAKIYCP